MRKISPQNVKDDFHKQITDVTNFYDEGTELFSHDSRKSTFAEHILMTTAVSWEGFMNDLFIAYVNRDASQFTTHLQHTFQEHVRTNKKVQRVFSTFGSLTIGPHLSRLEITKLADQDGYNITFSQYEQIDAKARRWLVPADAAKFLNLSDPKKKTVNLLIALRNHIAHRSRRSFDAMNDALATGSIRQFGLQRQANKVINVGAYLKSSPVGSRSRRLSTIMSTLQGIGQVL